jgi:hypothetical protein
MGLKRGMKKSFIPLARVEIMREIEKMRKDNNNNNFNNNLRIEVVQQVNYKKIL